MRVLMSAYACEPGHGSEPGVGWHFATAAARDHDVTVVTRANNRGVIESALAELPETARPTFEYLDLPHAQRLKRGGRGVRTYYVQWQRALARRAAQLHRSEPFDVVHHVTLGADWLPCGLVSLAAEVPLVWGPVGGATTTPWHLRRWLTPAGLAREAARTAVSAVGRRTAGLRAGRAARVVLANNRDVAAWFDRHGIAATVRQHAVVDLGDDVTAGGPVEGPADGRVAVFAGRLEGWKGLLLAIEAIARAPGWHLRVFGEGPDRAAAAELAARLGVDDRVHLLGRVPLDTVHRELASADALLFPSMHDSAPFIVAEAMALRCPVVCLARGGPADMVDPKRGIVVDDRAEDLPGALAAALAAAETPPPYDGRWSAARLPGLLAEAYGRAVGHEKPAGS